MPDMRQDRVGGEREDRHEYRGDQPCLAQCEPDRHADRHMQPEHRDEDPAGGLAQRFESVVLDHHFVFPELFANAC
ncbi:hypothetical protein [Bradyrhizobium japonicum]|uniref:hypothetical protein n=1 Tax=Bradyrhizobium japonicum TaxID=375 RepID=UPI003398DA73